MPTEFDYDLNIYHMEEENEDGEWVYTDQWYVDIYDYRVINGASTQEHVTGPFPISANQRDLLRLGEEGWDDDAWYGMWGFLQDYDGVILPELLGLLNSLPKYREDVLF